MLATAMDKIVINICIVINSMNLDLKTGERQHFGYLVAEFQSSGAQRLKAKVKQK